MQISPVVMDTLATQYQQALSRIQLAAEAAAVDAWYAHNSFEGAEDDEWEATYLAILSAAALAIAGLTAVYYQTQLDYLGVAPRMATPRVVDHLRDGFARFGQSPATRARFLISEGEESDAAIAEAATRVSKLTSASTRDIEQFTLADLMDQISVETTWEFVDLDDRPDQIFTPGDSDDAARLVGTLDTAGYATTKRGRGGLKWKRVPQGGACGWCLAQSSRLLSDATRERDRGWHNFCRCTWRMVTKDEARAWAPLSSTEFNDLLPQRAEAS